MYWFLSAIGSAFVFGLAGLFMKISQMRGGASNSLLLGLYAAGTCGFWGQALLTRSWDPWDARIWIAGAIVGLGSAWGNLLFMKALEYGPASLTSPLTNANILLVILMGALWFDEPLKAIGLIGVSCLLLAVILLSIRGEKSISVKDNRWYLLVFCAMLLFFFRNGGLKVTDSLDLDNTSVLWSGYLMSWIWFAFASRKQGSGGRVGSGRSGEGRHGEGRHGEGRDFGGRAFAVQTSKKRGSEGSASAGQVSEKPAAQGRDSEGSSSKERIASGQASNAQASAASMRTGFFWGLAAGICSYGGLQLYTVALTDGPSHLVAPIFATNGLVVALGSVLLYRERLTILQWGAFAFLMLGLVLVRM